jgi:hypothetical protein
MPTPWPGIWSSPAHSSSTPGRLVQAHGPGQHLVKARLRAASGSIVDGDWPSTPQAGTVWALMPPCAGARFLNRSYLAQRRLLLPLACVFSGRIPAIDSAWQTAS